MRSWTGGSPKEVTKIESGMISGSTISVSTDHNQSPRLLKYPLCKWTSVWVNTVMDQMHPELYSISSRCSIMWVVKRLTSWVRLPFSKRFVYQQHPQTCADSYKRLVTATAWQSGGVLPLSTWFIGGTLPTMAVVYCSAFVTTSLSTCDIQFIYFELTKLRCSSSYIRILSS